MFPHKTIIGFYIIGFIKYLSVLDWVCWKLINSAYISAHLIRYRGFIMNKNLNNEIGDALYASTIAYAQYENIIQPVITNEWDLAGQVKWIENLISKKIVKSTELLFVVKTNRISKRKYIQATKQGEQFLNQLKASISDIKRHYPLHRFNPYFELFIRNVEDRHLQELAWMIHALSDDQVVKWVDVLNGCVESIRQEANSLKFKNTINEYHRLANKNFKELMKYISALFGHGQNSRLLVLRIDLGYLKEHLWPVGKETAVQYADVKKHWGIFLRYLKTKLPSDCMRGFCWKLEYGLEKSFHFHVMIFLDGSKVREDVTIARLIGEHWSTTVTNGKGLYYNCNAHKEGYKSCGIGMVKHDDATLREGLEKAALYMTKIDYYIQMVAPGNGRTFGKGNMPMPKTSNRGRPRTTAKPISGDNPTPSI
jgi:hypothetical protein